MTLRLLKTFFNLPEILLRPKSLRTSVLDIIQNP